MKEVLVFLVVLFISSVLAGVSMFEGGFEKGHFIDAETVKVEKANDFNNSDNFSLIDSCSSGSSIRQIYDNRSVVCEIDEVNLILDEHSSPNYRGQRGEYFAFVGSYGYLIHPLSVVFSYCGDGVCDHGENCSTCPSDCGECSVGEVINRRKSISSFDKF